MHKQLLFLLFFVSAAFAEPSAFSAGDLSVDEPYGLTDNEKLLLKNIKKVKHLNRDKNTLYSEVENLRAELNGLRTVVDGLNQNEQKSRMTLKKLSLKLDDLQVTTQSHDRHFVDVDQNLSTLQSQIIKLAQVQERNYKKIDQAISTLNTGLKTLQDQSVSKQSFRALQNELNDLRSLITKEFKRISPKKQKNKKPAEVYKAGQKALKVKNYREAIQDFEMTIKNHYKPAGSHFYLAEAHYRIKSYKKAIAYYKESYKRYKKGRYNPQLFLHMALSLEYTKQKSAARKFFNVLIKMYPKSAEAKIAKKHL